MMPIAKPDLLLEGADHLSGIAALYQSGTLGLTKSIEYFNPLPRVQINFASGTRSNKFNAAP